MQLSLRHPPVAGKGWMNRKSAIRSAIVILFLGCGSVFEMMSAEGESYVKVESVNFHG